MRTTAAKGSLAVDERPHHSDAGGGRGSIDIVLPPVPRSVSAARHAVADLLLGAMPIPIVVAEDVLLLVSELVTNVVVHARTETRVWATVEPGRVSVAVGDRDPDHAPFVAERGSMATNGRGILLVDAVSSDWGIDLLDDAKVVWFVACYDRDGITKDPAQEAGDGRQRIRRRAHCG